MDDNTKRLIKSRLPEVLRFYGAKPGKNTKGNWDCIIENYNTSLLPQTAKKICDALELTFDELFELVEIEKGA